MGQRIMVLSSQQSTELTREESSGVYNIDVNLYLKIRFKLGALRTFKFKPKVKCDLKVPLIRTNGTTSSADGFETTRCDLDY